MVVATYIPSPATIIGTVRIITTIVVSEAFPFFHFGHHLQKAFYPTIHNPDSERHSTMTGFTPDAPVLHEIKNHSEELTKAEAGVAAFAAKRNNRWYPKFHIASNGGGGVALGSKIRTACASTRAVGTSSTSCTRMAPSGVRCIGVTSPPPTWSIGSVSRLCSPRLWKKKRTASSLAPQ